ncbi:hypothetical protein CCL24_26455 [Pseudomonas congelans]|nr:hypothetical protein CCL24_26455 [Pseudomonas congelans]PBP93559.1 hypothetical protein CCL17_26835 [Pseudomonas congelans]
MLRDGIPFLTLRLLFTTQSVENCISAERSSRLSCDAPRRMPFRTLRVLLDHILLDCALFQEPFHGPAQ